MEHVSIKERLHNMSFKEKCDYIWGYYKFHMLFTLILVSVIVSIVHSQITKLDVYCNITYIGDYISNETLEQVKSDINEIVLKDDKTKTIAFDTVLGDENSIKTNPQIIQKLGVVIAARGIDIAIVNKEFLDSNISSEMFLDLNTLEGFSSLPLSNYELVKDNNSSIIYGIKIKDINPLNMLNPNGNDNILVVISNSEKKNEVLELLKTILH